jgi:hypothetical protein
LLTFTDDTGIFQHGKFSVPRRSEGYTTDDNARALIACARIQRLNESPEIKRLANIYLAFLNHMQKPDGKLHNYLAYQRRYLDSEGSEDSVGRTLWGCGSALNSTLPKGLRMVAKDIFDMAFPWVWKADFPRFQAFAILGLSQYLQADPNEDLQQSAKKLADSLLDRYEKTTKTDWRWFEHTLTYDNARLPQALFAAYKIIGDSKYLETAKTALDFLIETQMADGVFVPIGNFGWYTCGEKRAVYDQQPLEASAMVEAAIDAHNITNEKRYLNVAEEAFAWFLGKNSENLMVYNEETAGCFDGVCLDKVNMNQGAESSISYLLARLRLEELRDNV